jgi:AcrR family transcriptional regulator
MQNAPTSDSSPAPGRGGRRRSEATHQSILSATREILVEVGVRGLTVEGVAARAGVAKTTVYRRWKSKDELALAVLIDMVEQFVAVPDLGDTEAEFIAFVSGAVRILGTTLMGRVMQGLVSDFAADPDLAKAFQTRVVTVRQNEVRRMVAVAIERGDMRADTDPELLHELLFGPVYYRLLLSGRPLEPEHAVRIVQTVLPAFAGPPAPGATIET